MPIQEPKEIRLKDWEIQMISKNLHLNFRSRDTVWMKMRSVPGWTVIPMFQLMTDDEICDHVLSRTLNTWHFDHSCTRKDCCLPFCEGRLEISGIKSSCKAEDKDWSSAGDCRRDWICLRNAGCRSTLSLANSLADNLQRTVASDSNGRKPSLSLI